jgi:hypothetical protein
VQNQLGGRGEVGKNSGAEKRLKKINNFGQGDVFLVHPENDFNSLILDWCIGGCWFTPAGVNPHPKLIRMVKTSVGWVSTFEHTS